VNCFFLFNAAVLYKILLYLKKFRLARNDERNDLTKSVVVKSVKSEIININTSNIVFKKLP